MNPIVPKWSDTSLLKACGEELEALGDAPPLRHFPADATHRRQALAALLRSAKAYLQADDATTLELSANVSVFAALAFADFLRIVEAVRRALQKYFAAQVAQTAEAVQLCLQLDHLLLQIILQVMRSPAHESEREHREARGSAQSSLEAISREQLLYKAFQYSTDGILITDLQGKIFEANQALLNIFGYTRAEVIGKRTNIFRSSRTADAFYKEMWASINQHGEWKGEIVNRRKDGQEIPILLSITPIIHQSERIGYMAVEIDITKKKKIESELHRHKSFAASLIETANSPIVTLDLDGAITIFNHKLEEITGYQKHEVVGKNWFTLFIPERLRQTVGEVFVGVKRGEMPSNFVNPICTKSGQERLIAWSNATIRDEHDQVIGVLAVGQDVTDQKRLEQQILQSERLSIIGQMAAKVAHEVRNPLSSISLNAELLEDEIAASGASFSSEAHALLQSIIAEVDRVAKLTEEYLQFSRLPEASPAKGDLVQVVNDTLDFIESGANSVGIQIVRGLPDDLPMMVFDSQQIRQALLNVLKNAIEAMKKGGFLRVAVQREDNNVVIKIADTGEGIAEEDRAHLFEPFFTTKDMGTGLGLAVTQQVIQEHGGKLSFESVVGEGTTFFIRLPIRS